MREEPAKASEKAKGISLRLIIVISVFAVILLIFLAITNEIVLEGESGFDTAVFKFLKNITNRTITDIALIITFFGASTFLLPTYILMAGYYLFFDKNYFRSFNVVAIGLSSVGLLFLVKDLFKRHRPPLPLVSEVKGYSYPSGHSFSAFTLGGLLIYILWHSSIRTFWKWIGTFFLFIAAALIAISRVYLHVHYASDVIAGFCLSSLWLTICIYILNRIKKIRTK